MLNPLKKLFKKPKAENAELEKPIGPPVFGEALNELEKAVLKKFDKEITVQEFIAILFKSDVFVLTNEESLERIEGKPVIKKKPSFFSIIDRDATYLCFFTHQDRASVVTRKYPAFNFLVQVKADKFLKNLKPVCGLIINPYFDKNLEWQKDQMPFVLGMLEPKSMLKTELENAISDCKAKKIDEDTLFEILFRSDVFCLSNSAGYDGLLFCPQENKEAIVPMFTSTEKATIGTAHFSEHQNVLPITFGKFINQNKHKYSIGINPFDEDCLELSPDLIEYIRKNETKIDFHSFMVGWKDGKYIPADLLKVLKMGYLGLLTNKSDPKAIEDFYTVKKENFNALVAFSNPQLLQSFDKSANEFRDGVLISGKNILELLPKGYGLLINLQSELEIFFTPGQLVIGSFMENMPDLK